MHAINLKFSSYITEGLRFPVQVVLGQLLHVPTDNVNKYVQKRPKTPKNQQQQQQQQQKMERLQHQLLWVPAEGQFLVL